jgi:nicotinamidase-related amidase
LKFGPLPPSAVHLCIDMQRLFAPDSIWPVPWMAASLPFITAIAEKMAERTVFTRFMPPEKPTDMPGAWRRYYEHWPEVTREKVHPELLDLMPPLARLVPPAKVIDKPGYSAFSNPKLLEELRAAHADTLVITGGETDVCVLGTVMSAVDFGYRVILPTDAVCSSSDEGHDSLVALYENRFSYQIETVDAHTILQT